MTECADPSPEIQDCVDLLDSHDYDIDATEIGGGLAGVDGAMDALVSDGGSEAIVC